MNLHPHITSQLAREHQRQMLDAARQRRPRRPNTAPASNPGRPAAQWITALRLARHAGRSWSYR